MSGRKGERERVMLEGRKVRAHKTHTQITQKTEMSTLCRKKGKRVGIRVYRRGWRITVCSIRFRDGARQKYLIPQSKANSGNQIRPIARDVEYMQLQTLVSVHIPIGRLTLKV